MPTPELNDDLAKQVMRQLGSRGGKGGTGASKKRPQAHYDRLARLNRQKAKLRRKAANGAVSL